MRFHKKLIAWLLLAAVLFSFTGICYAATAGDWEPGEAEVSDEVYDIGDDVALLEVDDAPVLTLVYDAGCGSVEATPEAPAAGDTVTVRVEAADEYAIESVAVTDADGNEIETVESESEDVWSFVMSDDGATVSVLFLSLAEFLTENEEYQPETIANYADTAILYSDGYLVFQYGNTPDSSHGKVIGTYAKIDTTAYTNNKRPGWQQNNSRVINVLFKDVTKPISTAAWFCSASNLMKIENIENLDTSNVTNMENMFYHCSSLDELDVTGFNTSNVTNMCRMFFSCSSLEELNLAKFDTHNVTNMQSMFNGCSNLINLDVTSFDTCNVTNMSGIFHSCSSLVELDVTGFDTRNVIYMNHMFAGCSSLIKLDVTGFDTSSAMSAAYMFSTCSSLTELDLTNFDTSNITSMKYMFAICSSLEKLSLGSKWKWAGTDHGLNDVPWYNVETDAEFTATTIPDGAGVYTTVKPVTGNLDVNNDGSVDFYDANYIIAVISNDSRLIAALDAGNQTVKDNVRRADVNNDGAVNALDLSFWWSSCSAGV